MKRKLIIIGAILLAVALGGGIVFYYNYQNGHYVTTDDAQVSANMVTITPQIDGAITAWAVDVGDQVTKDEVVGTQETDTELSSMTGTSSLSPEAEQTARDTLASRASVKSPIDGKIIRTTVVEGQMASTSTSLAVVADTADAYVTANIKETDIGKIEVGQSVEIDIDAFSGESFSGTVENVGQATESTFSLLSTQNSTGNYTKVTQLVPVRITINNADGADLMPGMNATVKILVK